MPGAEPVFVLDRVSFAYGHEPVLDSVSFSARAGEFLALVGPNGSGKSTLLRLLVGLLQPSAGTVQLFGGEPGRADARARLGFVPQRPSLAAGLSATVDDVVSAGRLTRTGWWRRPNAAGRVAVGRAIAAVGLDDRRRARVADLSGGQQQRAFIARALAGEPELLVLDEPVAGVDTASQRQFRDSLVGLAREQGTTVLLVSHELGAVADALDRVVVLKRRVRFDGPPSELALTGVSLGIHPDDLPLWLEGISP